MAIKQMVEEPNVGLKSLAVRYSTSYLTSLSLGLVCFLACDTQGLYN